LKSETSLFTVSFFVVELGNDGPKENHEPEELFKLPKIKSCLLGLFEATSSLYSAGISLKNLDGGLDE